MATQRASYERNGQPVSALVCRARTTRTDSAGVTDTGTGEFATDPRDDQRTLSLFWQACIHHPFPFVWS